MAFDRDGGTEVGRLPGKQRIKVLIPLSGEHDVKLADAGVSYEKNNLLVFLETLHLIVHYGLFVHAHHLKLGCSLYLAL